MNVTSDNKQKKQICIGILAHVDSGKTTLSESILYLAGKIKKLGRVDHQNAYLDNFELERRRGITIFSKQAVMQYKDMDITLLDTPGHVDFSAEMERTLQVLDYAILIVSGSEGVQGHTETLWKLLSEYDIPVFIFINKMDMPGTNQASLMSNLCNRLTDNVVDFSEPEMDYEAIAMCDEDVLEYYVKNGTVKDNMIADLILDRKIFPCYFGAALKMKGVEELLDGIDKYTYEPIFHEEFGAKIFKIGRDNSGNRLTYMKITGGELNVRDEITGVTEGERWSEKVNDIRIYSGERYAAIQHAKPGSICAVAGLEHTYSGQGLGFEKEAEKPGLQPVLSYSILLPDKVNVNQAYKQLKELEEEDPTLQLRWNTEAQEITADVMGPVQIQVLKKIIKDRFNLDVEFGAGKILYKETIINTVKGIGHFEPLSHYAEVHLLLEPAEPGSGISFESNINESFLARNWQRLIMTHLAEKEHRGVLTGAPVTDIHFTLIAGKEHLKHTEGGDFRQATYRAVRQGLKKAESVLLEPYYDFVLEIPNENVGRAMTDISQMMGNVNIPDTDGNTAVIKGYAPVSAMRDYVNTVNEYTHGKGNLTLKLKGYAPCHNQEEIIEAKGYDSETDLRNPTGSVFCAHGAGFNVPWNEVEEYMHIKTDANYNAVYDASLNLTLEKAPTEHKNSYETDKELMAIFEKTFGPIKRRNYNETRKRTYYPDKKKYKGRENGNNLPECMLVDGYNIIFAWEELKQLAEDNIDGARDKLLEMLSNYQAYKGNTVIAVFDAYNVKRYKETVYRRDNIYVVFTKEAETADMYIAKTTHKMASRYNVTVATSDRLEQLIIMGGGALRLSASGLYDEVKRVGSAIKEKLNSGESIGNFVIKNT